MKSLPALVVEDLPAVNAWLVALLQQAFPGIDVQSADSVAAAQQQLATPTAWRVVLLDLRLPDGSGIDIIRTLQARQPDTPVVVMTVHDDDDHLFRALAAGARGYLLKEQDDAQLVRLLQQLDDGQPPLSPRIARRMLAYFQQETPATTPPPDATLSPRETDVLACIARGLRVQEVAQQLGLTPNTVASYIKSIYSKLNISSRAEAALEASRRGLA